MGYNSGAQKGVGLVFQIRGDAESLLASLACRARPHVKVSVSGPCAFPPRDLASLPFDHLPPIVTVRRSIHIIRLRKGKTIISEVINILKLVVKY